MHADERYRRAAAAGGVGVWEWTLATGEIYVDPVLLDLLGYGDLDIRHVDDWVALLPADDAAALSAWAEATTAHDIPSFEFEYRARHRDGSLRWLLSRGSVIRDAQGTALGLTGTKTDITERKRREDVLRTDRRREAALHEAQHQVLEMIATGRSLGEVLESVVRLVENHCEGMLCTVLLLDDDGVSIRHGAAPSMPREYVQAIEGLSIGPSVGSCGTAMYRGERVIVTDTLTDPLWQDHRNVPVQFGLRACWSTPIFSPQRKVLGSFAMYYREPRAPRDEELWLIEAAADIARVAIEQQRAYDALRHSEARVQAILRAIPDWMFLTTVDGVFLDYHVKDASKLHVPPSTFLTRNVREVLPPPVSDQLARAFARVSVSDEPEKVEYALGSEDAERFYEACVVRCDGDKVLSIVKDITDRRRAELEANAQRRELAHLSRVAMLGELTGALAHELSQPLTAVLSNAQAARRLLDQDPLDVEQLRGALDDIIRNDKRAGTVIDRLRALLRKENVARQPVDVNEVAREVIDLTSGELVSRRVTVKSTFAPAMPLVLGDRVQLQQVVLNLVLNACDAMTTAHATDRELALSTMADDRYVELVVADRGPGIPDDQLERVFEPFVTFREQGLGLGLAISRSIVTAHGGSIRAEHHAGGGAAFRCLLPIS